MNSKPQRCPFCRRIVEHVRTEEQGLHPHHVDTWICFRCKKEHCQEWSAGAAPCPLPQSEGAVGSYARCHCPFCAKAGAHLQVSAHATNAFHEEDWLCLGCRRVHVEAWHEGAVVWNLRVRLRQVAMRHKARRIIFEDPSAS